MGKGKPAQVRQEEERKPAFSVSLADCEVQHFRCGGPGGQKQNKTSSGSRVIHHPSGARGESREERSQPQNTRLAFIKMVQSRKFQVWKQKMLWNNPLPPEEQVKLDMHPSNLIIMARQRCNGCGHLDCGQLCCIHDEGTGGEGHFRWRLID